MAVNILDELARLIERERDAILAGWRAQVRALPAARELDAPSLNDHIPQLLAELAAALRLGSDESIAQALRDGSPPAHGSGERHATPFHGAQGDTLASTVPIV